MKPAKSRERKCSTCKHYQPSPLWRKGWCRNPLLYDRNTNHLVEADSLACNRTFIDYWEPASGEVPAPGPAARSSKPRIAPSIQMDTTDPSGERGVFTGNTPAAGMAAVVPKSTFKPAPKRSAPPLALVDSDYDPGPDGAEEATKTTRQIEQVEGPPTGKALPKTAAQRIKEARQRKQPSLFGLSGPRLLVPLLAIVLLAAIGTGAVLLNRSQAKSQQPGTGANVVVPRASASLPAPTPTGVGDPSPTPNTPPTAIAAPPSNVIGVNGWVQVAGTRTGLTVRAQPGKAGSRVTVLTDGTTAHVVDGPKDADGLTWWKLDSFNAKDASASGWCAATFLQPIPAPTPAP